METSTHVLFSGHKPNNLGIHIFSQWYMADFSTKIKGVVVKFTSAEQYMMAMKALLFKDDDMFETIMDTDDPKEIKAYGRVIQNFNPNTWDKYKFDIVVEGNRLKFGQNPALMKRLMETGNKTLVEASPWDKIWGIGLSPQDAVKIPENEWLGENLLGKALMVVRNENLF